MTVYVVSCPDCDIDAGERHDAQETRADDLEDEVAALKDEITDLKKSIQETMDQMFHKGDC
jgi:predicted  nucleic acid-binding Zn-ribbon protein